MLTPSFDTEQDEHFVILRMRVPYAKTSEAEFDIDGNCFKFYCKPYFLRLTLPGQVIEDGREKASYDCDSGTMTVHVPKLNTGEHFKDLQMLTLLLGKRGHSSHSIPNAPLIEAIDGDKLVETAASDDDHYDWEMDQVLPAEEKEDLSILSGPVYGFASRHRGVFSKLQEEVPSIVDCSDPDHMTGHERRVARIAHEEASFDPDHYLADLMDNDYIKTLMEFVPPWQSEVARWNSLCKNGSSRDVEADQVIVPFCEAERDQMKELPNKEYLLGKATQYSLYLGLVDIMFAFTYDFRTTEGEPNVESAWTVCKISSTLSWLEVFRSSVHEVVYSCLRRSLCYPLYRHWQLSLAVLQDIRDIFHLGRRKLLQCLLIVQRTLNQTEPFYVMNDLYITDYCVWIQKASPKQIQKIAAEMDEIVVDISSLGWDLPELETAAHLVVEEEGSCSSEEHQGYTTPPIRSTSQGEEGLDEDLARMTLRSPQTSCLIEEISSSQSEGSSEDSSDSEDSKSETSLQSEESSELENPLEESSYGSPPLQPTATDQECVGPGKGITQTSPHPSVLPSTEHHSITN